MHQCNKAIYAARIGISHIVCICDPDIALYAPLMKHSCLVTSRLLCLVMLSTQLGLDSRSIIAYLVLSTSQWALAEGEVSMLLQTLTEFQVVNLLQLEWIDCVHGHVWCAPGSIVNYYFLNLWPQIFFLRSKVLFQNL